MVWAKFLEYPKRWGCVARSLENLYVASFQGAHVEFC